MKTAAQSQTYTVEGPLLVVEGRERVSGPSLKQMTEEEEVGWLSECDLGFDDFRRIVNHLKHKSTRQP